MSDGDVPLTASQQEMRALVDGVVPYVVDFIRTEWDWRPWMTVPPTVESGKGGPIVQPPGCISNDGWTVAFEGAYPWAIDFSYAVMKVGPAKRYLDERGLCVECETGYAISVHRDPQQAD